MKAKISWHGQWNEGKQILQTVGALMLVGDELVYIPALQGAVDPLQPDTDGIQSDLDDALNRGFRAEEVFDYYIDRVGNMLTQSYSEPETVQGKTVDAIRERIADQLNNVEAVS